MHIYAFILGRVYTLSIAELFAYIEKNNLPLKIIDASDQALVVQSTESIDSGKIMHQLGGIVKVVKIHQIIEKKDTDTPIYTVGNYFKLSILKNEYLTSFSGKMQVGISLYSMHPDIRIFDQPKRIGMLVKKILQDSGKSIRIVLPQDNQLSLASVQVTNNGLLEKGCEINVLVGVDKLYVGKTLVVQDFADYGRRDYQRPIRDMVVGMIPPKVAQTMLNLTMVPSSAQNTLYDPFCGLGTIVQEAVLQGFKCIGSDIEKQQIMAAEKNLEWFKNRYKIPSGRFHLETIDARECSNFVNKIIGTGAIKKIDAVVTEGTLGPMYSSYPPEHEIEANFKHLASIYKDFFKSIDTVLVENGKIVMCLPAYRKNRNEYALMNPIDFATDLGYNIVDILPDEVARRFKFLRLTERKTCIYDRKDQIVAREIVIFQKNK